MFVHLHVHSRYSLLDGLADVQDLVQRAKELGMPAVALTDHGVLYGLVAFYRAARQAGVQPILGMEAYLTPDHRARTREAPIYHLLLLAYNNQGLRNLFRLATLAQLKGFYQKPRIDHEWLAQHHEGLIVTTGCMSAEIPSLLKRDRTDEAEKRFRWYLDLFGRERFFVELQRHDDVERLDEVNRILVEWARKYRVPVVATNDVHYVRPEDAARHDILLAIQTGKSLEDPKRLRMGPTYYFRTPEEMAALFHEIPEALSNTLRIAEMAQDVHLELNSLREKPRFHLPDFPLPEGQDAHQVLRQLVEEGLRRRYGPRADDPEVRARLEEELSVIHRMGFDTYFLIVWDLVRFARERNIWNNARGSAGGSLVAYCLGITMVDPLEHDLLFERFLNADRQTMPDIDLDFPDDRRDEVMQYIKDRYGEDHVAQIITFGTMKARAAVRDVGRILGIPLEEVDRLAKLIPHIPSKPVTLKECLEGNEQRDDLPLPIPELVEARERDPRYRKLLDTAKQLEGAIRNVGTHAAGVVIAPKPLIEYMPLHRNTSKDNRDSPIQTVTQFEMNDLEDLGMLKVDCLGLATMTVMQRACELIEQRHGRRYTLESIPTDDPKAYQLLAQGHTAGLFQTEGQGFTRMLMKMRPTELRHVIAAVALYRPGPMQFIDTFIRRMHGQEEVTFLHPDLEDIYGETYGLPVYQEQVMLAARKLAGFTGPEADFLRRAIAKKKKKEIEKFRVKFIEGAVARGIPRETAERIFDEWKGFASYAFNKSHAATYAVMAVQTAYLKANYPLEYMTALLSVYMDHTEKVALYVADCRRMGIPVFPPDINRSYWDFRIEQDEQGREGIRFGLGAVKHVSRAAVEAIVREREENGPFQSLGDFVRRVDLRHQVGKRTLESLIKVGALDAFGDRNALLEALEAMLAASDRYHRMRARGQLSLFGTVASDEAMQEFHLPEAATPASVAQKLQWERELVGIFLARNPLDDYLDVLPAMITHRSSELQETPGGTAVVLAGLVTELQTRRTRQSNQTMAFATLEDIQGPVELVFFPKTWQETHAIVQEGALLVIWGKLDPRNPEGQTPRVLVNRAMPLEQAVREFRTRMVSEDTPPAATASAAAETASPASPANGHALHQEVAMDTAVPMEEPHAEPTPARRDQPQGRQLVIHIHPLGDLETDRERLLRLHQWLQQFPGQDHYTWIFHLPEGLYLVDFPQQRIEVCDELLRQLRDWGLHYEVASLVASPT